MQTELREAARRICRPAEILGAVGLICHLGKACFVQGLKNERIQTTIRSRGESISLAQAVEFSLEEKSAILSKMEKPTAVGNIFGCTICNRIGHTAGKCASKTGLSPAIARADKRVMSVISCYNCGRSGHIAKECRQRSSTEVREHRGRANLGRQQTSFDSREPGSATGKA